MPVIEALSGHLVSKPRHLCPYMDRHDGRCAGHLTLTNLREAFRLCAGDHEACSNYHRIHRAELAVRIELPIAQSA
jgi:hypothetical protein